MVKWRNSGIIIHTIKCLLRYLSHSFNISHSGIPVGNENWLGKGGSLRNRGQKCSVQLSERPYSSNGTMWTVDDAVRLCEAN